MKISLFNNLSEGDKSDAVERLISGSTPSQDFFLMIILAILMASFGFLLNSTIIVIGSMLIAPILYPFLSLSLGVILSDFSLIARSFYTVLKSMAFGVAAAAVMTLLFSPLRIPPEQNIITHTEPSILFAAIAIIAGFAAAFALVKPHLNELLPGVAISVALVPPLAVIGIGIAKFDLGIVRESLLLFLVNAIGIVLGSMIVFALMDFYGKKKVATQTIRKEKKKIDGEAKNEA